ncbi:helix-turn-helix domain-containing protein [Streptomyces sp. NRRL S-920]|uniref:helix-turn-helix domain-containing protein n=1 Tax=Streptomyces sp. NRRL S-920 TaxID=1463921 RepID=UPI0004C7B881|nr:helix-turn-helix transcriptional regulator [Streptomyces sp. NRRL S-920]
MASLAELLRELKERSGLSYGVLAKRLHMSTSTLHRYCNGDAVPVDFAPVERFARLCKASPEELVEVHRRWILADAAKGQKAEPRPEPEPEPAPEAEAEAGQGPEAEAAVAHRPLKAGRRRLVTLVSAAAGVAVIGVGSVALAMNGDDGGPKRNDKAAAPAHPSAAPDGGDGEGEGDKDRSDGKGTKKGGGPSASPFKKGSPPSGAPRASGGGRGGNETSSAGGSATDDLVEPLTTRTRPYVYEDACTQHFLVNRKAHEVPQPPSEQDAPAWVADLGAVSSGEQFIEVTVQGIGEETVVLQDMDVRVRSTSAPLAWNDYAMETGCGGKVNTKSFGVDLDDNAPRTTPKGGQRDFPYKVSENDPEVFYIKAHTTSHDVRWYLELEWSSGKRHGTLRVDDQGKPFRTSGREERPSYGWPPGSSKWYRQLDS